MSTQLHFYSFDTAPMLELAKSVEGGRLKGGLSLTLTDAANGGTSTTADAEFYYHCAEDIAAVRPEQIRLLAPRPNVSDAETTKLVHVDFFDADLPWRFPSELPTPDQMRPWKVLVVGPTSMITVTGATGGFDPAVLKAHPLAQSRLWAHVQESDGAVFSRLYSPAALSALSSYTAAIVPGYSPNGNDAWDANGQLDPSIKELPVLFSWRFSTGEEGDFETLAAALRVRKAGDLGKARVMYRRPLTGVDVDLDGRGAITSLQTPLEQVEPSGMVDTELLLALRDVQELLGDLDPATLTIAQKQQKLTELRDNARQDVTVARADLDLLNLPVDDTYISDPNLKRDFIDLPTYGRPWVAEPESMTWGNTLNDDPRFRGIAGLGQWMAIQAQEALMAAAVDQAGSLSTASQRIGDLALGLSAAGSLWKRKLPADAALQLRIFGPAMDRVLTTGGGSVLDAVTSTSTWLDRASFTSAAQRVLRNGTGIASKLDGNRINRTQAFSAANSGPRAMTDFPAGLPHLESIAEAIEGASYVDLIGIGSWPDELWQVVMKFVGQPLSDELISTFIDALREFGFECGDFSGEVLRNAMENGVPFATCELLVTAIQRCRLGMAGFDFEAETHEDREQVIELFCALTSPPCPIDRRPIDPGALATAVGNNIDPTRDCPPASQLINSMIDGIDSCPPNPPELPIRIDFPTWTLLNQYAKEWLLPGASSVEKHSIVALQTNPVFIDAYMVGINTQFMSEMRWRGLAIDRAVTPLRMFWGQMNYQTNKRGADIQPLRDWTSNPAADLGDLSHQVVKPGDVTGKRDLIILFRSPLFRRYPRTVIYLVNKLAGTEAEIKLWLRETPLFVHEPEESRVDRKFFGPIFRGEIEPDLHFFAFDVIPETLDNYWVVLDEPPAELRLRADRPDGTNSAETAVNRLDHPTRVAIDGAELEKAGLQ